eukprot:768450-Hanusia_phi.AAC.7
MITVVSPRQERQCRSQRYRQERRRVADSDEVQALLCEQVGEGWRDVAGDGSGCSCSTSHTFARQMDGTVKFADGHGLDTSKYSF